MPDQPQPALHTLLLNLLPTALPAPLAQFHTARQAMQAAMDYSIAANADNETLCDEPMRDKNKLRMCGPFTIEVVPFSTALSLEKLPAQAGKRLETNLTNMSGREDNRLARRCHTSRQYAWRDELLKTGIRGKGGQKMNTDLLTKGMKKAAQQQPEFWLMGRPDVLLPTTNNCR